jgi:HEAT repeat protein
MSTSIIDSIAGALLGLGATCAILDPQAVKMGAKFVEYPDAEVRIAAARLLGFVGDHSCILILERLSRDPDKEVRRAVRVSINEIMERRQQKMANSKGGRSRG